MPFQAWDVIPHTQLYSMRSMGCAALQCTTQPQNRKGRGISQMKQCCTKEENDYPTGYYHLQEYGYLFIFSTLLSIPFYYCSPIRNHGSQKTAPRSPSFIFTSAGYMWKYTASTSYLLEDMKALFWEGSWVEDASMYCVSRLPSPGCMHSSHWASSNITKDCGHSSSLFYLPYYLP